MSTADPTDTAAVCDRCGQTAEDHVAALCRLTPVATAAACPIDTPLLRAQDGKGMCRTCKQWRSVDRWGNVRRHLDRRETIEGPRRANAPTPIRPPVKEANGHDRSYV